MLLPIHIAAGMLAIVLGAVALIVQKGGTIHRRSGLLFVCAMLVMGTTASILGFRKSPTDGNVFAGFMTAYFVVTALTTVRPVSPWTRGFNVAALAVAIGLAFGDIMGGVEAFNSPGGLRNGQPDRTDSENAWRRRQEQGLATRHGRAVAFGHLHPRRAVAGRCLCASGIRGGPAGSCARF